MKTKSNLFTRAAIVFLVIFSVITVITLQIKLDDLKAQKIALEAELDKYSEKVARMEYELSLSNEEYIEKYAREVLGYHKNGEIVFKNNSDN